MQVSSNANNTQAMNQYQLRSDSKPENSIQSVLEQTSNNTNQTSLKPQDTKPVEDPAQTQVTRDTQRENATNALAQKSQQSRVEINLAGGNNSPIENNTADIIESLRGVQKQNNAVQAYATYKENQNTPVNNLARGLVG